MLLISQRTHQLPRPEAGLRSGTAQPKNCRVAVFARAKTGSTESLRFVGETLSTQRVYLKVKNLPSGTNGITVHKYRRKRFEQVVGPNNHGRHLSERSWAKT